MNTFRNISVTAVFAVAVTLVSLGTAWAAHSAACCKFEGKKSLTQRELPQGQNEILMMRVQQMERAQKEAGTAL
jgi:hypothetical protein